MRLTKQKKCILTIMSLVLLLNCIVNSKSITALEHNNPNWEHRLTGIFYTSKYHEEPYEMRQWLLDGEISFCIQESEGLVGDNNHWRGYLYQSLMNNYAYDRATAQELAIVIAKIIREGWHSKAHSMENYAITQVAIWKVIEDNNVSLSESLNENVNALVQIGRSETSVYPSFNNKTIFLEKGESIILKDANAVITKLMEVNGFAINEEVISEDKSYSYSLLQDNQLKISLLNYAEKGILELNMDKYKPETLISYNSTESQDLVLGDLIVEDSSSLKLVIKPNFGELRIKKLNPPHIPIKDIEFVLENSKGEKISFKELDTGKYELMSESSITRISPDKDGNLVISNLIPDIYTLVEVQVSQGTYSDPIEAIKVEAGTSTAITVTNKQQTGSLHLTKQAEQFDSWIASEETIIENNTIDSSSQELPDIKFELYIVRDKAYVAGNLTNNINNNLIDKIDNNSTNNEIDDIENNSDSSLSFSEVKTETAQDGQNIINKDSNELTECVENSEVFVNNQEKTTTTLSSESSDDFVDKDLQSTNLQSTDVETQDVQSNDIQCDSLKNDKKANELHRISEQDLDTLDLSPNSIMLNKYASISSNELGMVTIKNLEEGYYILFDEAENIVWRGKKKNGDILEYKISALAGDRSSNYRTEKKLTVYSPIWNDKALANTEFKLYADEIIYGKGETEILYQKADLVKTALTDELGKLEMHDIPLGNYYLQESKVPLGFVKSNKQIKLSFKPNNSNTDKVEVELGKIKNNRIKINVQLNKILEQSKFIDSSKSFSNIYFGVYNQTELYGLPADSLIKLVQPDQNGVIEIDDLPHGIYYLKELATDYKYELDEDEYTLDILPNNQSSETQNILLDYELENKLIKVKMELKKIDRDTGISVSNSEFKLEGIKEDGSIFPIVNPNSGKNLYKSDENGIIRWSDLELGKYRITEVKAAEGYLGTGKTFDIVLSDKTKELVRMEVSNKKTHIEISKYDIDSGELVEGAVLVIKDSTGTEVERWISSKQAKIIRGLKLGEEYTLLEEKSPSGYVSTESVKFTVEDRLDGQNIRLGNKRSIVEISKLSDIDNKALSGASLKLCDDSGNTIASWISGTKPHLIYGLVVGETYFLIEEEAPTGYIKSENIEFIVKDSEEIQKINLINHKIKEGKKQLPRTGERVEKQFLVQSVLLGMAISLVYVLKYKRS